MIGGLVGNFTEGLGLVRTEGGLVIVVVAEVGCRVILGRGLRAILKIDRVYCCGGAKRLTFGDSGVHTRKKQGENAREGKEKMCLRKIE